MNASDQEIDDKQMNLFVEKVRDLSEYDFSNYSDKSLKRRLAKVLLDTKSDMDSLLVKMANNRAFLEKIIRDITVNTTELFRDPVIWNHLKYDILPRFKNNSVLKIWHAGCSTGQEVYSMLILLHELGIFNKADIFATDINSDVIETAKLGVYKYRFNINYLDNFDQVIKQTSQGEYVEVPYTNYFSIDKTRDQIKIDPFLTRKPVFAKMDLISNMHMENKNYDIIVCRNVIIYFNYELQNRIFKLFYNNLAQGGVLLLGVHETILGPFSSLFDKKFQAYFKK